MTGAASCAPEELRARGISEGRAEARELARRVRAGEEPRGGGFSVLRCKSEETEGTNGAGAVSRE